VIKYGADSDVWAPLVFVTLLVPITLIDLDVHLIPNVLTGLGAIAAVALVLLFDSGSLVENLISAAAAGGFFLLAALVYPAGMGMGDVKLAGMMGLFLGSAVAPAVLAALLSGVLVGAVVIARKGAHEGRKTAVPFGPFLAFGALLGVFAGQPLVDLYVNHFLH
jgi:leader peptidase (prepilin peptidase) / N-methyltransferase